MIPVPSVGTTITKFLLRSKQCEQKCWGWGFCFLIFFSLSISLCIALTLSLSLCMPRRQQRLLLSVKIRAALERSPVATWTSLTGSVGLSRVPSNAHWGSLGLQQCLWVSCKASSAVPFGTLFLEAQTRFRKKILQTFQQPCEAPNILLKRKRKIFSAPPASQLLLCLVKTPH